MTVRMSNNQEQPQTSSFKPKTIQIYLTSPPSSQASIEKWNSFFRFLTTDPRWTATTQGSYACPVLPNPTPLCPSGRAPNSKTSPAPLILSLTPNTSQRYTTRAAARAQEERTLKILLQFGFKDVSGTWNPKIVLKWEGYPDQEWVGENMKGVRRQWVDGGGYERMFAGYDGKDEVPGEEWMGFVKRFGGVNVRSMKGGKGEVWVVSKL